MSYTLFKLRNKFTNLIFYYGDRKQIYLSSFVLSSTDIKDKKIDDNENIQSLVNKYENKILYNCIIEKHKLKLGYRRNKAFEEKKLKEYKNHFLKKSSQAPLPVALKYFNNEKKVDVINVEKLKDRSEIEQSSTYFPFENTDKIIFTDENSHITNDENNVSEKEVSVRKKHYDNSNWMTDYENFTDKNTEFEKVTWKTNYGTPDPNSTVSNVPCGGCGSLLHCKDTSIPGYIPSEIFKNHELRTGQHLRSVLCQRCHFLKYYDMALQVRVSPNDYPKVLEKIKENNNALVILMVDLLDFPCSIWPNIIHIIGNKRPVIVIGNKIDLLPQDTRGYLEKIKNVLAESIHNSSLHRANIQHIALISAKTGYGVEELITKLHNIWEYRGDVYLIGCTNVGKSTLFNVLLQSDYCKIKAVDLIQRATTSLWPGTTLNLLKFPILRPSGWRLYVRTKRLMSLNKIKSQENRIRKIQLQKTQNLKYATIMGNIERTFTAEEPVDNVKDIFAIQGHDNASGKVRIGINENDPTYKLSKWCYDTPGVVQPDQILHLLNTEELMLTLPKQLIQPKTFSIKPGFTIFLAGLGRLDFIHGPESMRFTVFASDGLPVTICKTEEAESLYKELLGTQLFNVPVGNKDRLQKWPRLEAADNIKLTGIDWNTSCADILLSSAGWISITLGHQLHCTLKAWTPEKRGIFIRNSILPKAVTLRGNRLRNSPAYKKSKYFIN